MMIKPTSKTIFRHIDNGQLVGLTYHNTKVVNVTSEGIVFNSGGWATKNTARAMTFALNELGHNDVDVVYRNNKTHCGLYLRFQAGYVGTILKPLRENVAIKL